VKSILLSPNIILLLFPTSRRASKAMMRMQGHYENPRFRGQVFTADEFSKWYRGRRKRSTYCDDWAGFHFTRASIEPFYSGDFQPLHKYERTVLRLCRNLPANGSIIGVSETVVRRDQSVMWHELAHAMYNVDIKYRHAQQRLLRRHDMSALLKVVSTLKYHKAVHIDEMQAYMVSDQFDPCLPCDPVGDFQVKVTRRFMANFVKAVRRQGVDFPINDATLLK